MWNRYFHWYGPRPDDVLEVLESKSDPFVLFLSLSGCRNQGYYPINFGA
jgi:hypothetical protein